MRSFYDSQVTRASPHTAASSAAVAIRRALRTDSVHCCMCLSLSAFSVALCFAWNILVFGLVRSIAGALEKIAFSITPAVVCCCSY